ncbi:hypothetical protein CUMW_273690 [Citrus unshiu]|uniref:Uncharacterized protein n=1 Tax=Citrus unshiu TaxID=55188 RepID=A0A2H5MXA4_CITUN|nr:hypothetical protein CUMW_273690 [Citrus unshiu]
MSASNPGISNTASSSRGLNASAASAAAFLISLASVEAGTGNLHTESAKFRQADFPLSASAATSCALAAISGEG